MKEEFDKKKFDETFEKVYDEKSKEFDEISNNKLIISLIGGVNSGKSSTINALTGIKHTEVKAVAGWTKEISLYELKKGVFIADTPGLFDIDKSVSDKASAYVESNSDIILFFLNAAVGITKYLKDAYAEISKLNKETIVVLNKIDTLDPVEVGEVMNQVKKELGVFPVPISSKTGEGIDHLNSEIIHILEKKSKDLLFLKISKHKDKSVKIWINGAAVSAAAIGAIPIPGSDIVALTTLQVTLAMKIAYIYDIKPSKNDVMKLVGSTVTGSIGKNIARWSITALKAAGWIPGGQLLEIAVATIAASVAGSLTYGFGWACNEYYKSGMTIDLGDVGEIFNSKYKEHKNKKE